MEGGRRNGGVEDVKFIIDMPGGSVGSVSSDGTPGGLGPGKYVRRLNAVERELEEYKLKCLSLEKRFIEFEDWRGKLDTWLIDSFGVAINSGIGKSVAEFTGGEGLVEPHSKAYQFPVTPLLTPKSEKVLANQNLQKSPNVDHGLHSSGKGHVSVIQTRPVVTTEPNRKNATATQNGIMLPPKATATTSSQELKTSKASGSATGTGKSPRAEGSNPRKGAPFYIGSNITLEITKTPAIELERCDAKDDGTQSSSMNASPLSRPKPVILTENEEGEGEDNSGTGNNEISILFSSPPLPSVGPHEMNQIMDNMSQSHSDYNDISLGALVPDIELVEGEEGSGGDNQPHVRRDLFHLETDDPTPCAVCGVVDPEPQNEMIFCDVCGLCVHQGCYGVGHIPPGGWKCSPCVNGVNPSELQCYFCPEYGGALKPVKSPGHCHWAHMSCSMWIPEVKPENPYTLEPICGVSRIPKDRWKLKCSLCKNPRGACIQCQYSKRCTTAFHVTCAMKHGLEMKEVVPVDGTSDFILQAYCKAHTYKTKPLYKKKNRTPSATPTTKLGQKKTHASASFTGPGGSTTDSASKKKRHTSTTPAERESPRKKKRKADDAETISNDKGEEDEEPISRGDEDVEQSTVM